MTAVFYDNNKHDVLRVLMVQSITIGYKSYKMIHKLEQCGKQSGLSKDQLYYIVKSKCNEDLYLPMNQFDFEGIGDEIQ